MPVLQKSASRASTPDPKARGREAFLMKEKVGKWRSFGTSFAGCHCMEFHSSRCVGIKHPPRGHGVDKLQGAGGNTDSGPKELECCSAREHVDRKAAEKRLARGELTSTREDLLSDAVITPPRLGSNGRPDLDLVSRSRGHQLYAGYRRTRHSRSESPGPKRYRTKVGRNKGRNFGVCPFCRPTICARRSRLHGWRVEARSGAFEEREVSASNSQELLDATGALVPSHQTQKQKFAEIYLHAGQEFGEDVASTEETYREGKDDEVPNVSEEWVIV